MICHCTLANTNACRTCPNMAYYGPVKLGPRPEDYKPFEMTEEEKQVLQRMLDKASRLSMDKGV